MAATGAAATGAAATGAGAATTGAAASAGAEPTASVSMMWGKWSGIGEICNEKKTAKIAVFRAKISQIQADFEILGKIRQLLSKIRKNTLFPKH